MSYIISSIRPKFNWSMPTQNMKGRRINSKKLFKNLKKSLIRKRPVMNYYKFKLIREQSSMISSTNNTNQKRNSARK